MNSGEMTVVLIVAIVMIASVLRARARDNIRGARSDPDTAAENQRLRDEVQELKERLKVLERITVDKEDETETSRSTIIDYAKLESRSQMWWIYESSKRLTAYNRSSSLRLTCMQLHTSLIIYLSAKIQHRTIRR